MENQLTTQLSVQETRSLTPSTYIGQQRPYLAKIQEDYPKIRDDSAENLSSVLNYVLLLLNVKYEKDEEEYRDMQMLVLCDFVRAKFGQLTSEEIKNAFQMYVAREFPNLKPFRVLDSMSLGEILNAYIGHRNEHLRIYAQKKTTMLLAPPKTITEDEKKSIMNDAIERLFEEYKLNRSFSPPFSHAFKELVERSIIPYPNEKSSPKLKEWYSEKRQLAQELVKKEIKAEILNPDRVQSKTVLQQILSQVQQSEHEKIELKLQQIILEGVFQRRINENKSIEDWLK